MNRRRFVQSLALAGTVLTPIGRSAWAATSAGGNTQRKLIVIMLRGAVDGLSVVVPYGDPAYYKARSSIAIPRPGEADGAYDLDGHFGLHPALAPLQPLWQRRALAFVHAAGSPDTTRSHFDAQDYMESGTPGRKSTPDGWMNRLLSVLPGVSAPTRAVSIGPVMPRILTGTMSAANIPIGEGATRPTVLDRAPIGGAFDQLYKTDEKYSRIYKEARESHQEVMSSFEMDDEMRIANGTAPMPNSFPADADRLATLMRNDKNVQMAFMALGGWDTHANQGASKGQLANRLAPLGEGLALLSQRLGPLFVDTTIVVMSEFGRTVHQNGNGGTDHGHGNVMWILGGNVAGGKVYGDWRGLAENQLYEGRDVPVTTDFRLVLANVLEGHMQLPAERISRVFPTLASLSGGLNILRNR